MVQRLLLSTEFHWAGVQIPRAELFCFFLRLFLFDAVASEQCALSEVMIEQSNNREKEHSRKILGKLSENK